MKVSKYTMMVVTLVMSFGLSAYADNWAADPNMGTDAASKAKVGGCPLVGHVASSTAPRDGEKVPCITDKATTPKSTGGHSTSDRT